MVFRIPLMCGVGWDQPKAKLRKKQVVVPWTLRLSPLPAGLFCQGGVQVGTRLAEFGITGDSWGSCQRPFLSTRPPPRYPIPILKQRHFERSPVFCVSHKSQFDSVQKKGKGFCPFSILFFPFPCFLTQFQRRSIKQRQLSTPNHLREAPWRGANSR